MKGDKRWQIFDNIYVLTINISINYSLVYKQLLQTISSHFHWYVWTDWNNQGEMIDLVNNQEDL